MIVVVSPAKKLDFETQCTLDDYEIPVNLKESKKLISKLKTKSVAEIASLMKISPKLAKLNYDRYQSFKTPFNTNNAKQALMSFRGDTYVGLDADSFTKKDISNAQKYFRILSGLYGLLKPLDLIQPYRLEMGTKIGIGGGNLYDFWSDTITAQLNTELVKSKSNILVNCASNEYSSAINFDAINSLVISPVFKEKKGDGFKIISIFVKRARGAMARFIIQNNVKTLGQLKKFNLEGYELNEDLTIGNNLIFTRDRT
jgi:uncharacterized protein